MTTYETVALGASFVGPMLLVPLVALVLWFFSGALLAAGISPGRSESHRLSSRACKLALGLAVNMCGSTCFCWFVGYLMPRP